MTSQHQDIEPVLTVEQVGDLYLDWHCFFKDNPGSAALCIRAIEHAVLIADRAKAMPDARWLKELEDLLHELSVQVTEDALAGCIEGTDASYEFSQAIMVHARRRIASTTDAQRAQWMTCESRQPWAANSLHARATEMRQAEKRCRNAYRKDYMGEPARYVADALGEAAAALEARLAILHATTQSSTSAPEGKV